MNWRTKILDSDNEFVYAESYGDICKEITENGDGNKNGSCWIIEYRDSANEWIEIESFTVAADTGEIEVIRASHLVVA